MLENSRVCIASYIEQIILFLIAPAPFGAPQQAPAFGTAPAPATGGLFGAPSKILICQHIIDVTQNTLQTHVSYFSLFKFLAPAPATGGLFGAPAPAMGGGLFGAPAPFGGAGRYLDRVGAGGELAGGEAQAAGGPAVLKVPYLLPVKVHVYVGFGQGGRAVRHRRRHGIRQAPTSPSHSRRSPTRYPTRYADMLSDMLSDVVSHTAPTRSPTRCQTWYPTASLTRNRRGN